MDRPLIAVTGPQTGAKGPRWCVALSVWVTGGRTLQLRPNDPMVPSDWDGVVVTGGHDIDPVLYAAEPEVHPRYDPDRDAFESQVIDQALSFQIPLLGICRGAQLLNVRRGGDLHQDLRNHRKHTSHRRSLLPLKTLLVAPGSRLAAILGKERSRINSLHNQAIDRLGSGLVIVGRDKDRIVQAIEDPGHPFLIGVQWHPEFLFWVRRQRSLFATLVHSAAQQRDLRRQRHADSSPPANQSRDT